MSEITKRLLEHIQYLYFSKNIIRLNMDSILERKHPSANLNCNLVREIDDKGNLLNGFGAFQGLLFHC